MKYYKLLLSELKEYYYNTAKRYDFLNEIEVQSLLIKVPSHLKPIPAKRFPEV